MARPIRNTPILIGTDADRFLHEISVLPSEEERKKERARIEASAQQFLSLVLNVKKKKESCGKDRWLVSGHRGQVSVPNSIVSITQCHSFRNIISNISKTILNQPGQWPVPLSPVPLSLKMTAYHWWFLLVLICSTKVSEKSDMVKSWTNFCCSGAYKKVKLKCCGI